MGARRYVAALAMAVAVAAGLSRPGAQGQEITTADLEQAAADNAAWLMYGRDYRGHRFVDLDQITPENVSGLRPVWVFATGSENRGLQATPLLHEGVLYLSADESRVFAIDARTGARKWSYDPELSDSVERVYCCGRTIAAWRCSASWSTWARWMPAWSRSTGIRAPSRGRWRSSTGSRGYSITGAPLVVDGMVLTGVAGGEFSGPRRPSPSTPPRARSAGGSSTPPVFVYGRRERRRHPAGGSPARGVDGSPR